MALRFFPLTRCFVLARDPCLSRGLIMALFESSTRRLAVWFCVLLVMVPVGVAAPGLPIVPSPPAPVEKNELTPEIIASRRAALQKELEMARVELSKIPDGKLDETALWLTQETALLERIDNLYVEQQRTLQHTADLTRESLEVEERTKSRRPPQTVLKPPFGVELLDQLYAERDYLEQARGWLKTDVTNATDAVQEARDDLEGKERARRGAREALEKAPDQAKAQSELRLAELEARLAEETVQLREKALRTLKLQQSLLEPKQALLRPNFDWLRAHLVVAEDEVAAARVRREKRQMELDVATASAKGEADKASRLVIVAERRASSTTGAEELESRRADRQTVNRTLGVLSAQRERLDEAEKVAEARRAVLANEMSATEMRGLDATNRTAIQRIEKERRLQLAELLKGRQELQDLQGRLTRAAATPEGGAIWVADRVRRLSDWVDLSERELADLDGLRTERLRLKEELGTRVSSFSWSDSLEAARKNVVEGWNYEVFSVQDQPVRVRTILAVIAMVMVGHWLSRLISRIIGRTVFGRFGMNPGRRAAWQTLSFYALFLVVVLAAFNLFHLSLTQFSVVSGALAVGIGFGSQNLLSNFISGIILLIERPVNEGDVIEIDGQQVTVEEVGPRSTIVRSANNTHVIVPNSRLLEQPVINWTLSDDVVRRKLRVGVAYGSPTREVNRILQDILNNLPMDHPERKPGVTFCDFGENALVFEVQYWTSVQDGLGTETELRHRIAEAFTKANIVMAFPQRDVHLDTTKPLQIELSDARLPAAPLAPSAPPGPPAPPARRGPSDDQAG